MSRTMEGTIVVRPLRWVLAAAVAALFWLLSIYLILDTPLLKPFFEFQRSSKLLLFVLAHGGAGVAYSLAQRFILGMSGRRVAVLGLLVTAGSELLILFWKLWPVMIAELVTNRLFYLYFLAVSAVVIVLFVVGCGWILFGSFAVVFRRGSTSALFALPLALIAAHPWRSMAIAVLVSALLFPLARQLYGRLRNVLDRLRTRTYSLWQAMSSDRVFPVLLFLAAFVLQCAYAVRTAKSKAVNGFIWDDAVIYEKGALELANDGYSLFLRAVYEIFGHSFVAVGVVQSLFGAATCVLIFLIGSQLLGRVPALLASMVSVGYGTILFMPALHARETLLTFALAAVIYASLVLLKGGALYRDAIVGAMMAFVAMIKVIAFPVILIIVWFRVRARAGRLPNAVVAILVCGALFGLKFLIGKPVKTPVGSTTTTYAAFNYFAGNHPFSSEGEWFNLSEAEYQAFREMGFNVGEGAGSPAVIAEWQAKNPRIAYCDPVTFETNTWNLIRYNLKHPGAMLSRSVENFCAFFLGVFKHHRIFDTVFLLNKSAFCMLFRIHWLILFVVGWVAALRRRWSDRDARNRLLLVSLLICYFAGIYTVILGTNYYTIPIIPYMLIFQSFGVIAMVDVLASSGAGREPEP